MYLYSIHYYMTSLSSPITHFWIILILAFIFFKLKRIKVAKGLTIVGFLQLFLFTVTPLPVLMVRSLEQQYSIYNPGHNSLPVLVLGAGHVNDPKLPALQRLSIPLLDRVAEGVRMQNKTGGKITFSGFSRFNKSPHAVAMSQAAVSLGVEPSDTIMLIKPSNTKEEAQAYKARFGTGKKFILVTSAIHMPRAIEIFEDAGLKPIAAPTNFINRNEPGVNPYNWWPSSIKSIYTEIAIYEYINTWYYRWTE